MGEVGAVDDMLTTHDFQTWWARNTPLKTTVCTVHAASCANVLLAMESQHTAALLARSVISCH